MASVFDVAHYLLALDNQQEGDGLSNLKLQKLCYYSQGFYLAIFDIPLFEEEVEAWVHGPVIPELYHRFKVCKDQPVHPEGYPFFLSQQEKDLIDEVYDVFGQYAAWKLRNMTHEEPTWINHESSADIIPKHEMQEYFKSRLN